MKSTELKVALRGLKGNPQMRLRLSPEDEVGLNITVEKTKLVEAISGRFPNRSDETGLKLLDDGFISTDRKN